jgi:hypothetical protein
LAQSGRRARRSISARRLERHHAMLHIEKQPIAASDRYGLGDLDVARPSAAGARQSRHPWFAQTCMPFRRGYVFGAENVGRG